MYREGRPADRPRYSNFAALGVGRRSRHSRSSLRLTLDLSRQSSSRPHAAVSRGGGTGSRLPSVCAVEFEIPSLRSKFTDETPLGDMAVDGLVLFSPRPPPPNGCRDKLEDSISRALRRANLRQAVIFVFIPYNALIAFTSHTVNARDRSSRSLCRSIGSERVAATEQTERGRS
jgi:hypothetical protein